MATSEFNWNKITSLAQQVTESPFMAEMVERSKATGSKSPMGKLDSALLYALTRWRQPRVIVESGGFLGMSSAFILKALADEGVRGVELYSVEMLDCAHGSLIPDDLRPGFIPLKGRIEDFMKGGRFPAHVEMFLHDSSHRLKHMLMEYRFFWKSMQDGDLLVSHDVNMTAAFTEFVTSTYRHDGIGQADPERTAHTHWGRWGNLGFVVKKGA